MKKTFNSCSLIDHVKNERANIVNKYHSESLVEKYLFTRTTSKITSYRNDVKVNTEVALCVAAQCDEEKIGSFSPRLRSSIFECEAPMMKNKILSLKAHTKIKTYYFSHPTYN